MLSAVVTSSAVARATGVHIDDTHLRLYLSDGREIAAPLAWFPLLESGTLEERQHWRLIGDGAGVHWPDLDEDVSVAGLLGLPD